MLKKILIAVAILILIGVGTGVYMWNKPHRKVENEKCLVIKPADLYKEYSADENKANAKYLNKAIEVNGAITEVDKTNGLLLILDAGDPTGGIQCAMRDTTINITKGSNVTIRGICSGYLLPNVSLTDCVTIK